VDKLSGLVAKNCGQKRKRAGAVYRACLVADAEGGTIGEAAKLVCN